MATQKSAYGEPLRIDPTDCDEHLQGVVTEVHHYLIQLDHHWLLIIKRSHYRRCCDSWKRVSTDLEKFLNNPRLHYSSFMMLLEQEMEKFSRRSFYAKQLKAIHELVSLGPNFSIKHCQRPQVK